YEKGSGSVLYFENAKKDFEYLGFEKGVERSEYYIKKIRNRGLIYWIFLIIIVSLISLTYLFIIRKRIGKKEKKKRKENKDTKKELKDLVEKYANGEISLEEFDRKKKKVMK
ncbi:MAG TPA: SHOCT domain-containing protein, partial [Methanomicrobia archaeon]|nr:SHOCT domain-containing protein [Methanomicrobia archaeon]